MHGIMIDAGSTGSRLHVYEYEPRVLQRDGDDIQGVLSGTKLSFPGTESHWTEKMHPGLSSFAHHSDDELPTVIANYLEPLISFAKNVLISKENEYSSFPIYLGATGAMRLLHPKHRTRIITTVQSLFANKTFCPFWSSNERIRILSGEEEAAYGWATINILMGTLLKESRGKGPVVNPRLTHGALDMGGVSTQIAFYESQEDILSDLFNLHIGQGKHWNLYTHSFLSFGVHAAKERFVARLLDVNLQHNRTGSIHNPCFPGGTKANYPLHVRYDANDDKEILLHSSHLVTLKNDDDHGNYHACANITRELLNKRDNKRRCHFVYGEDCSFAGVYQPQLPNKSKKFGEFIAFSLYYHVWQFLRLPKRASLLQLKEKTMKVCAMSKEELDRYNNGMLKEYIADDYCFRSAYTFEVLHHGYGFELHDHITVAHVLNGHKVGWALGAMMFEINTLPWEFRDDTAAVATHKRQITQHSFFWVILALGFIMAVIRIFKKLKETHGFHYNRRIEYIPLQPVQT